MFGCGLPVAAKSCPALHELVINGINGMIFDSSEELAKQVPNFIHVKFRLKSGLQTLYVKMNH